MLVLVLTCAVTLVVMEGLKLKLKKSSEEPHFFLFWRVRVTTRHQTACFPPKHGRLLGILEIMKTNLDLVDECDV